MFSFITLGATVFAQSIDLSGSSVGFDEPEMVAYESLSGVEITAQSTTGLPPGIVLKWSNIGGDLYMTAQNDGSETIRVDWSEIKCAVGSQEAKRCLIGGAPLETLRPGYRTGGGLYVDGGDSFVDTLMGEYLPLDVTISVEFESRSLLKSEEFISKSLVRMVPSRLPPTYNSQDYGSPSSTITTTCGAPTQNGGRCKRKVKGGGYCYQHR